jgi:hypothetical protein
MKKGQFFALLLLTLIMSSFISGCAGVNRIGTFFQAGEFKQHAKIIDFCLFFVIFFSLCYIGFSKVWGEGFGKPGAGKGSIVGLSFALALALAFAIVSQTKFSITTIFPLAKAIFFIVIWFLLWGLMNKTELFGTGWLAKIAYAIMTFIMAYILFSIATHMICQMSDNMDDPACKSDFFNAAFNLGGRLFGTGTGGGSSSWGTGTGGGGTGTSGGTSGGTGGGGTGTGTGGTGTGGGTGGGTGIQEQVTGPVQGGCRLDITFAFNSFNSYTSGTPVADYVKKVKAAGKTKIYAYGFASSEGGEKYNIMLSGKRAEEIVKMIRSADPSMSATASWRGPTTRFDPAPARPDQPSGNRRVVLTTEEPSSFLPVPPAGSIVGCDEAPKPAPTPAKTGISWTDYWWLLLIIALLLLWLAVRRKSRVKTEDAIAMKIVFLQKLEKIYAAKEHAWHRIVVVDPTTMKDKEIQDKAQLLIDEIEKELKDKKWKPIKRLAEDYGDNFDRIVEDAKCFHIDDEKVKIGGQHANMLVKMLKALRKKYAPSDKFFAKKWNSIMFDSRLHEVTSEIIHENKLTNEYHEFFKLQVQLDKEVKRFSENEEKILVKLRQMHYSTMFGGRFWGTKHFTRRKGFPWLTLKDEVEGELEEHMTVPSTRDGIVDVTQEVRNLCLELVTKIQEVLEEEKNVTQHVGSRVQFTRKYDEEKLLIRKLADAIRRQKLLMRDHWEPIIDKVEYKKGKMHGHIEFKSI